MVSGGSIWAAIATSSKPVILLMKECWRGQLTAPSGASSHFSPEHLNFLGGQKEAIRPYVVNPETLMENSK